MAADKSKRFILWFNEIGIEDIPMVGGKNASLGEMYQKLHQQGITSPMVLPLPLCLPLLPEVRGH